MSILQQYIFDIAGDFNLTNSTIDNNAAVLSLTDKPAQTFSVPFGDDSLFVYNSALVDFAAGVFSQKDQSPPNSVLGGSFSSFNLNWNKAGSTVAVLNGAPTIVNNKLVCSGTQGIYYAGTTSPIETHKFKYTPNYSIVPPTSVNIFSVRDGTTINNRFLLTHSSGDSTLRVTLNNSSRGFVIGFGTSFGIWSPTQGVEYEFEIVINSVDGAVRLFIDGVLITAVALAPWSRLMTNTRYYLGADMGQQNTALGSFDDYIMFSDDQHSASYTPGYSIPSQLYLESVVDYPDLTHTDIGNMQSLDSVTSTEVGAPGYIINGLYWDGSSWVASDRTYSQSNSLSTVNANISQLAISSNTVTVSSVFPSSNSISSVSAFNLNYTGQRYNSFGYVEASMGLSVLTLLGYSHTATETLDYYVRVVLKIDNVLMYWDGTAWVISDGTEQQSNTELEVSTNLSALTLGSNSTIFVRWLLISSDDNNTPMLESSTVIYCFGAIAIEPIHCLVYGYTRDVSGVPVADAEVVFELERRENSISSTSTNLIIKSTKVSSDINGYFSVNLIRSSEYSFDTKYRVKVTSKSTPEINRNSMDQRITFTVPDADMKDITDLI